MNTAISIETEILQCLPQLSTKQKRTVLSVVKTFAQHQADWWDEISEAQQKEIDKSLAQMKEKKITPHHKVMQKYKR